MTEVASTPRAWKTSWTWLLFTAAILTLALVLQCQSGGRDTGTTAGQTDPNQQTLATVNGEPILLSAHTQRVQRWQEARRKQGRPATVSEVRDRRARLARQLVDERLIVNAAQEQGLSTPDPDTLLERFSGSMGPRFELDAHLAERGQNRDELLATLTAEHLLDQLATADPLLPPDDGDIADLYERERSRFNQPAQVWLRLRSWSTSGLPSDQRSRLRTAARAIADSGSLDATAASTLDRASIEEGWFTRDQLEPSVAGWAFAQRMRNPDEPQPILSGVLSSAGVIAVAEFLGRRSARQQSLAQSQDQIRSGLNRQRLMERRVQVLQELRAAATLEEPVLQALAQEAATERGTPPPGRLPQGPRPTSGGGR